MGVSGLEVLRDYHPSVSTDKERNPRDLALYQLRCRNFLKSSSKKFEPNYFRKTDGMTNAAIIKCKDNVLAESLGLSLLDARATIIPKPLPRNATRYLVPAADLPDEHATNLGIQARMCVELPDGSTSFEVSWDAGRILIVESLDGGSVGYPPCHFMYSTEVGVRGTFSLDPPHIRYDHLKNDVAKDGLLLPWAEMKVGALSSFGFHPSPNR